MIKSYNNIDFLIENNKLMGITPSGVALSGKTLGCFGANVSYDESAPYFLGGCGLNVLNATEYEGKVESITFDDDINVKINKTDLSVETIIKATKTPNVMKQKTVVTNKSDKSVTLNHVSSVCIAGIGDCGEKKWSESGKLVLYYCKYGWSSEAQWVKTDVDKLGIVRGSRGNKGMSSCFTISSKGSWTTGKFYPMMIVEDTECGICYFAELETPGDWTFTLGVREDGKDGTMYIEGSSADYYENSWKKVLASGESYQPTDGILGSVKGSFESAVKVLTDHKRAENKFGWTNGYPYVCFNSFMNCIFGLPTDENLIPLIDRASEMGVEIFCIDAGWYKDTDTNKKIVIGDWVENDLRFGEYGFDGILNYIQSKGMIAGVWTELESLDEGTVPYNKELCLKGADGKPLKSSNGKYIIDITKEEARAYLLNVVDRLYKKGVRYIKNDYNASTVHGPRLKGETLSEGNNIYAREVKTFYESIREKYPDLILENCGSGAMRSNHGLLSSFTLQSISDEDCYFYYPSILSGSAGVMPPEKEGIWTLPYSDISRLYEFNTNEYRKEREDGEETIFNMVNGMLGCMYLSGRIDVADETNQKLIKEGVDTYKKIRKYIPKSYPVYPSGFIGKNCEENVFYGLAVPEENKMLLAVYKLGNEKVAQTDLSKYGDIEEVIALYPQNTKYELNNNKLKVEMPDKLSARLFELKISRN